MKKKRDKKTKCIIIGLDGSTWDLMESWIVKGKLPLFKELIKKGVKATLYTTIPSSTIPALPSLYTGMNPGEHGILKFTKPDGDVVNMSDVSYPKIWNLLDRFGLRSLIFNVRFTYPAEPLNGIMFSGNPHPPVAEAERLVHPSEIFGVYKKFYNRETYDRMRSYFGDVDKNKEKILEVNIEISRLKFEVFKELVEKEGEFDFIFYWNGRPDGVMHRLWHHPNLILSFYKHVEEEILSWFLNTFPETNILILSDHGFHQAANMRFHLNNYLEKEGFLLRKGGKVRRWATDLVSWVGRNYIPSWLVEKILGIKKSQEGEEYNRKKEEGRVYVKSLVALPGIDYKKSKAVMRELWGIDLLNCEGEEKEKLAQEVISSLYKARYKGKPVVSFAIRKEDFYSGKYLNDIPDIIFQTEGMFIAEYELSQKIFSKPRGKSKTKKYGEHKNARKGIFIATGPDIKKNVEIERVSILDILPTVLHILHKPIPSYLNGRVLTEIFSEKREVKFIDLLPTDFLVSKQKELSREEKEEMKDRLKALGYADEIE